MPNTAPPPTSPATTSATTPTATPADGVHDLCAQLAATLLSRQLMMATAESCTGGLIAGACTDLSGSSAWFERGFVTYSNAAKMDMLGVPENLIATHGAVSEPVARAMAQGAVGRSQAQVSVAVTGVAGPTGGSPEKPVGTVWFAWTVGGHTSAEHQLFPGDRAAVRAATVRHALQRLLALLG
jgi:nicotinamide-nucleotide amidase